MKFTIDKTLLIKPLSHIQSIVERRNTIPILSNVVIKAHSGVLSLSATDMDIDILENIECNVLEEGNATITAHILYEIVKKLPDGSELTLEKNNNNATLISNKSKFTLPLLPIEDYPDISDGELEDSFLITSGNLRRLIDRTKFAISIEETRYYLNGIFFHILNKDLIAVATDGHRLAKASVPMPTGAENLEGIIVPRKTINEIRKLIDEIPSDTEINVSFSDSRIKFKAGKTILTSKLIDGNFPDYEKVIPSQNKNVLNIDSQLFSESIDRVSTIFSDKSRSIKLIITNNVLKLDASSPDTGFASEEIQVDYIGEDLNIGFNSRYLLDITSQIGSGEITILFDDDGSPALINSKNDNQACFVIMPMRI